jgi:hypothetical protein
MTQPVKLSLSTPLRGVRRDLWRPLSDLVGGALSLAVWVLLWAWVAVGVVAPLSTVVGGAESPRAAYVDRT